MYWFIHYRYSFYLYVYLLLFIYSIISGKTMKNLRNWRTVELVTSEEKLKKLASQPSFKQFKIFHENLAAVERAKVKLTLNRPIYVGFAILDLSKTLMYDFHNNYIKQKYPDATLLFTDTYSLMYQIQTDNVCENFYADKHLFDFSGYEKESPLYNNENKKVIGKIKDELNESEDLFIKNKKRRNEEDKGSEEEHS